MTHGGGHVPASAIASKQKEQKTAAELHQGRLARDLAMSLDIDEDMLSNITGTLSRREPGTSAGESSAAGMTTRSTAVASSGGGTAVATPVDDFATAFEKYKAGRTAHPSVEGRQPVALSSPDSAALLCSAVDLSCLREEPQVSGVGAVSATQTGCGGLSGVASESQGMSESGDKSVHQHSADSSALKTATNGFSAAERSEFSCGSAVLGGSTSSRGVSRTADAQHGNKAFTSEEDILSSSLFSKLLKECQANGCFLSDLTNERPAARHKTEAVDRGPGLSPELMALLQHRQLCRLAEKTGTSKRLLASAESTVCNSNSNSRRTSSCSPGGEDDGSEEARAYKRRIIEMHLLDERRSSFASSSRSSGSGDLKLLAASLASSREGVMAAGDGGGHERKQRLDGAPADSPSNPTSPSYLAELQFIERVAAGESFLNEDTLTASSLRGPLGYYSVCEAAGKEDSTQRLYPIVRGVSRDNTKKRWAVYWKGYRRYFYDKFFESCIEAYRRAVQFRQQATTAAAAVAATGNTAHLIAAGLQGNPTGSAATKQPLTKVDSAESVTAVLASAAAAVASQANTDGRKGKFSSPSGCASTARNTASDNDRALVCLYKEAILFVIDDLRSNVVTQYLSARASSNSGGTSPGAPQQSSVESAAAMTAKRLLDQLLMVHSNLVGNATSASELQPSLMIVAPCLEDLKLPSQQGTQQQLLILQSILAMHIQQLLLLSRYLNKGGLISVADYESSGGKSEHGNIKGETAKTEASVAAVQEEAKDQRPALTSS
ncbi:uncharacterized protein LOC34619030 [Cyclospora cayetanensis]|uniref:Uncharacterized protein LOC34619030 n=1 Tax=Cyclospora cayetanensis TaxID=88456 RepID=A0A6P6S332_9EIME|nr:uncharacterized protein LOC34619030 [Cyclospora cayetanensis]